MEPDQKLFNRTIKAAHDHFEVFVEEIIGLNNSEFHNELDRNLNNPLHKKIVITFPRDHGKSTHISVAYPLYKIANNHNLRILLISDSASIAKSFLSQIINHVERNDLYRAYSTIVDPLHKGVIPKMKNYKKTQENWSGDSIVIDREDVNLKDPTIHAVGLFGAILSKRADIIICDDIVNQENSATEEQRRKAIDWIYTTVMPVLVPGGIFCYLGNTWHQSDLVSHLLKDPQFDYKARLPAIQKEADRQDLWQTWSNIILDESKTIEERKYGAEEYYQANKEEMDKGSRVLWPERYPYKELYLKRLSNSYSFERMYQCNANNRPDQKFKDEWLDQACKKGAQFRLQEIPRENTHYSCTTTGVDLAISQESTADDTVLLTLDKVKYSVGDLKVGDVIIRNIVRGKLTPNETRLGIKRVNDISKPDGIRVETVAYQESILRDLEGEGMPIHGYHTGGEKKDPDIGVNSLAILAEQGKLVIPFDPTDARTQTECAKLINEMRAFPDGHTGDALMALWFAYSEMRDLTGSKYMAPTSLIGVVKVGPDISKPEVRIAEEKKADRAAELEQLAEKRAFGQMMGKFIR